MTGQRTRSTAGGVLPGYSGVIVRDGYLGKLQAPDRCAARLVRVHLLRDLKGLYDFEPSQQHWASQMAGLLIQAATPPRPPVRLGSPSWTPRCSTSWSSDTGNSPPWLRRQPLPADPRPRKTPARIARRFLGFEDLILRFATRPDLDIFSNNEAERTVRPVKVQQRSSGGCWRTIDRLADFALIQSYLSAGRQMGHPANSTPSATCSTVAHGLPPASNPPDNVAMPLLLRHAADAC